MNQIRSFATQRQKSLRLAAFLSTAFVLCTYGAFAAETGTNLPWEGPLTTLVTSLTGPVAYAISVVAIVALGATLAFAGGEMGETMKRLLHVGIAVCCIVFAAQVMSSFIGQAAEISVAQPDHAVTSSQSALARG
jgi:type IV secretory pathway VirB2 component (pilin)